MIRKRNLFITCLISILVAVLISGASYAQQPTAIDIWQLAPSNSLFVAVYDARPDNASMQVLAKVEDPAALDVRNKQQVAMRKAVEDLATLFGISLDFAKDIQSWMGQQWAFVLLPGDKNDIQPVFILASNDPASATATLQKILAPWQRVGNVTPEPDSDYSITSFKTKDKGIQIYASASGPVAAFSTSKDSLKQALKGGGFTAGSPADKTFKALSGSLLYVFADPVLLKQFNMSDSVPVTALGLGVSVVETGMKLRVLGYPDEQGVAFLKQMFPTQPSGSLAANPGIPSVSLAAASFPSLNSVTAMAGVFGMTKSPIFKTAQALNDMQISAAITAALPTPAGVVSAMAESDQAAADKLAKITAGLKQAKLSMKKVENPESGTQAATLVNIDGNSMYLMQVGKYILLASDTQSLAGATATIKGEQSSIAQSNTYKEAIAGLGNSNLQTLYVNLAPVQGLGFLLEGLGFGQVHPLYGSMAKGLENLQALALGVGFNGEVADVTLFLRAKPGMGTTIGPAVVAGTAIGAAVMFPVFARAREAARVSSCQSNLKQLAVAAQWYANDHDGKLPTRDKWQSQLKPYLKGYNPECPDGYSIYAFNKNLSGVNLDKIENTSDVIMFFEADPDLPNASGSRADAIIAHGERGCFAYVDTHVMCQPDVPGQSQWVPQLPKPVKKAPVKPVKKAPVTKKYRH